MAIDRLTGLDRLMLGASRTWPQDIGAIALLDGDRLLDEAGRFRIDVVRDAVERRLHLAPRFRQVIHVPRRGLGGPLWVDAPTVDLTRHVRELGLEPPAGEDELIAAAEHLLGQPLEPSRPLWEMWFLTGLPERRVGLFVRIHHTIADGMAAMTTVASFLDPVPDARATEPPPWTPAAWPAARALLADNLWQRVRSLASAASLLVRPLATARRLREGVPAVRELLAERPASKTSLDRMVGRHRKLALVRSSLEAFKQVGGRHDATVNDVLLAVIAAGLRALLRGRGEPVDETTLRIYVPVSLRRRLPGPQQGNLFAQMAVPLHLGERDPGRRLRGIAAETTKRKARARTSLGTLLHVGILRRLMLLVVVRQRVNLTSASIPGPTERLYLAGAPILEVFPVLPLIANEPLGIGALSYAGSLNIGIAADRDAFPDIDVFTAGVRDELDALGASAGATPGGRDADAPPDPRGPVAIEVPAVAGGGHPQ